MIANHHEKDLISLLEALKDTTKSQWITIFLLNMGCKSDIQYLQDALSLRGRRVVYD